MLFDGIIGLGLPALSLTDDFSFFDMLSRSGQVAASQFGVFLTEGEHGEESEIALGGLNPLRTLSPPSFVPVMAPEHGHWLIAIKAVRVNGVEQDICKDGSCRAVVDTGTSHIGVPLKYQDTLDGLLTRDAADYLDCRLIESVPLEFELEAINLTLSPSNYMRRIPVREGLDVGVTVISEDLANAAGNLTDKNDEEPLIDANATNVTRLCSPRLMPVDMPT